MPSAPVRSLLAGLIAVSAALLAAAFSGDTAGVPADDALILLRDGNRRFVAGEPAHFQQDASRRRETATNGQKPFAVVLTCSDSRVPPELLFDQGIGCLFVIRVAGNVAQTDEVATVEYGTGHLGARLIVVLGHTKCGAVTAVVEEAHVGPNLAQLVKPIVPAAARARTENPGLTGAPLVAAAIRANIEQAMEDLRRSSAEIATAVSFGQVRIIGALYNIETGEVTFFERTTPPTPAMPPADPHAAAPAGPHAAPKPATPAPGHGAPASGHAAPGAPDHAAPAAEHPPAVPAHH